MSRTRGCSHQKMFRKAQAPKGQNGSSRRWSQQWSRRRPKAMADGQWHCEIELDARVQDKGGKLGGRWKAKTGRGG